MSNPEQRFLRELEVFRTEAQSGAQFLYGYLAFNSILSGKKKALNAVNKTPLFWNTTMGALQTAFFIVLGRIFDQGSTHNVDRLLKLAQDNIGIFSEKAFANRRRQDSANADEWLDNLKKIIGTATVFLMRTARRYSRSVSRWIPGRARNDEQKMMAEKDMKSGDRHRIFYE